jgi:hypothetical protein
MRRSWIRLAVAALVVGLCVRQVVAECVATSDDPVKAAFESAGHGEIFLADVTDVTFGEYQAAAQGRSQVFVQHTTFKVIERFKGSDQRVEPSFDFEASDETYQFRKGQRVLVFASPTTLANVWQIRCSPTHESGPDDPVVAALRVLRDKH